MNKKGITKKDFHFLQHELHYLEQEGIISSTDKEKIMDSYEEKSRTNFIQIVLTIGALLLGIGVLSFVASNWAYLNSWTKLSIIIVSFIAFNIAGIGLQSRYAKTSRSLHYVAILIFGAGIFLIEQMYNISINFNTSFLLWAFGTIFIGYYLKDIILLLFTTFLLFIYLNGSMSLNEMVYPYFILIFLPVLYYMLKQLHFSQYLAFVLNALAVNTIALALFEFVPKITEDYAIKISLSILFVLGLVLAYAPIQVNIRQITHIQGHLVHGIAALFLTYEFSFIFAIVYLIYLLYLVNKGNLVSIAIICALILRYYIDYSYDFLPKSLVFIISGIILIGFGFFFEHQRKKGGKFE